MVLDQKPDGSLPEVPLKGSITLVKKLVNKKVDEVLYLVTRPLYPLNGLDYRLDCLEFLHRVIIFDRKGQLFSYRLNI